MTKPRTNSDYIGPHFAMSADHVAASLDIGETALDLLVDEGQIPKPFRIPGHPKLVRWDAEDIYRTVKLWKGAAKDVSDDSFGEIR
jgi:hypothetical protein